MCIRIYMQTGLPRCSISPSDCSCIRCRPTSTYLPPPLSPLKVEPSPGADVRGVGPVPVPMWIPSWRVALGADVAELNAMRIR